MGKLFSESENERVLELVMEFKEAEAELVNYLASVSGMNFHGAHVKITQSVKIADGTGELFILDGDGKPIGKHTYPPGMCEEVR